MSPRVISPALIGLGAFLVVAGVLVRLYAYPALAAVPTNYDSITTLQATDATIFNTDPEVLAPETTDLAITSHTVAGHYPDAPAGVVVWANSVTVRTADGGIFQQSTELSPFDATTGAASSYDVGFSSATEGEQESVVRKGQVYKFPFNTQKKDYLQWDSTLGEATTASFEGETEVDGLTVYKFVQTIEPTVVEQREVPGSVFGLEDASVEADLVYAMTRTQLIEPVTGAPVNRIEERRQVLSYDGIEVPAFVGTVQYTQASIDDVVDQVKSQAPALNAMRLVLPIGMSVLGLLAVAGGVFLSRRRPAPVHQDDDTRELSTV